MKKICLVVLSAILVFSLSACNAGSAEGNTDSPPGLESASPMEDTTAIEETNTELSPSGEQDAMNHPEDYSLFGTWSSDTGSVTHLNEDGTGKTVDDTGEHEFTWEKITLKEALERRSTIRDYFRIVYGEELAMANTQEDDWGKDDYLLSLAFDEVPFPLDFPYTIEDDTLVINTMQFGQILSPTQNISSRLEWVALTRTE